MPAVRDAEKQFERAACAHAEDQCERNFQELRASGVDLAIALLEEAAASDVPTRSKQYKAAASLLGMFVEGARGK